MIDIDRMGWIATETEFSQIPGFLCEMESDTRKNKTGSVC